MWCGETLSLLYWLRRNLGKPSCLKIGVSFSRFHTVYLCFLGNYYFFYFLFNASNIARNSWMCVRYFYSYFCKIMYIWRLKNIFFAHFKTNSNSVFFVVVLVSPDFRLLTFVFSTSVGRGRLERNGQKAIFWKWRGGYEPRKKISTVDILVLWTYPNQRFQISRSLYPCCCTEIILNPITVLELKDRMFLCVSSHARQ